ncbi:TetR/AcrR family transcriptional regulator [Methylopila sp. Yamaguchi]|uniref:TetR/AcrR family transcriptional regulator n=1 Tax=Methylopila sp. Yamaguchi TaxID=1437817 RepID=UPI000CC2FFE9|nr:TetR/AcrR family transcriptional regulator [Methylopila sp. Yamaguchi]GBD49143.1 TetR family transcriptional regulator [Methylopila sp. Yamaguchi]
MNDMTPPLGLRAQRQEDQRRRILDAAIACFARGGFHATGMQAICAEAGMSPGGLYRYFPSKEAIIEAIVERDRADIAPQLLPLLEADDVVGALIDTARAFMTGNLMPESLVIFPELNAEVVRNPAVRAIAERCEDEMRDILVRVLERGMRLGQIDPTLNALDAVRLLMAMTDGVLMRLLIEPGAKLDGLMPMYERAIRNFLAPQSSRAAPTEARS